MSPVTRSAHRSRLPPVRVMPGCIPSESLTGLSRRPVLRTVTRTSTSTPSLVCRVSIERSAARAMLPWDGGLEDPDSQVRDEWQRHQCQSAISRDEGGQDQAEAQQADGERS